MNERGLTITIGCPGAGKSTWADKNLPDYCLRLERDRFREALFGSRRAYHEDTVLEPLERSDLVTECMTTAMLNWKPCRWALTDTGLEHRSVAPFIELCEIAGLPVDLVVLKRAEAFLKSNNKIRPHAHRIPEEILEQKIEQFNNPNAWWRLCDYPVRYI